MKLKDLLSPFILIAVGLAFLIISALVFLNKGKSRKLIASKLKIGAFLLTFSWFVSGCDGPGTSTCYLPAQPENIAYILDSAGVFYGNPTYHPGDIVHAEINYSTYNIYSYELIDSISNQVKQSSEFVIDSLYFDKTTVHFILNPNINKGTYTINFFGIGNDMVKDAIQSSNHKLYIK